MKKEMEFYPKPGDLFSVKLFWETEGEGMLFLVLEANPCAKPQYLMLKTLNPITSKVMDLEWQWVPSSNRKITLISRAEK